jgi:prepilin-type N-terminal cleavage/methylation domain-containing protein
MKRSKAFTLIELLVVIAIIALLMAILMPALQRVKKQARAVVCLANCRQWSLIWSMYCQENNGFWLSGAGGGSGRWWFEPMMEIYKSEPDMRVCPQATKALGTPGDRILVQPGLADGRLYRQLRPEWVDVQSAFECHQCLGAQSGFRPLENAQRQGC